MALRFPVDQNAVTCNATADTELEILRVLVEQNKMMREPETVEQWARMECLRMSIEAQTASIPTGGWIDDNAVIARAQRYANFVLTGNQYG